MNRSILSLSLLLGICLMLASCKKSQVQVLKKGKWQLNWKMGSGQYNGQVEFKKNGKGEFTPEGGAQSSLFWYEVSEGKAKFQWTNPNFQNTIHEFDIVIDNGNIQVWEEINSGQESTFAIRK